MDLRPLILNCVYDNLYDLYFKELINTFPERAEFLLQEDSIGSFLIDGIDNLLLYIKSECPKEAINFSGVRQFISWRNERELLLIKDTYFDSYGC